jgi:hypothetical protein
MFEQIFDSVRKASEQSVQLQQEMLKQVTQQWMTMPAQAGGGTSDWGRGLQKRWAELSLEILKKQRESVDAAYASGIQLVEQSYRVSEAKTPDDYRQMVEDLWRKIFESFKDRSESQFRDFQKWSEKSAEIVQDVRS